MARERSLAEIDVRNRLYSMTCRCTVSQISLVWRLTVVSSPRLTGPFVNRTVRYFLTSQRGKTQEGGECLIVLPLACSWCSASCRRASLPADARRRSCIFRSGQRSSDGNWFTVVHPSPENSCDVTKLGVNATNSYGSYCVTTDLSHPHCWKHAQLC
jgi:hypothetical protein